jgi:hypothetical protein
MILIGLLLFLPTICDRHANCQEADAWAARWGKLLDHPNRRPGQPEPHGRPVCAVPGCNRLVFEWGRGHEGHVG